ncbi:MAG: PAS domain-containing sensor histidine kinase [Planctomycetota bacterium]
MTEGEHYLKQELKELFRSDPAALDYLEESFDGVWYWNVEEPEHEWLSPRFKALFGYQDHEVPQGSAWWQENIHPEDLGLVLAAFEAHSADPTCPYDQIVRYRHKDGSTVWVRCRGVAIRRDGVAVRMLGTHVDVSEFMHARREVDEFARSCAHDLRSPLGSIYGLVELALEGIDEGDLDSARTSLSRVLKRTRALVDFVDSLLALTVPQTAPRDLDPVELGAALDDAWATISAPEGFAFERSGAEASVIVPHAAVMRVLTNLLGNAVTHHGDDHGRVHASIEIEGQTVLLSVEDDGRGIPPERREEAFRPFQHWNRSARSHGLGLALVKRTVEAFGGSVWLAEASLGGCRAVVRWPLA